MKLNPDITELVEQLFEWSSKVIIEKVGKMPDGSVVLKVMAAGRESKGYTFQLNHLTVVKGADVFLQKILMCPTVDSANFVFSPTSLGYLVAFFDKQGNTIAAGHGGTLGLALNRALEFFDRWCERQKEKTMKTREQLLLDVSNLQVEINTASSRKLFPPTLCLNLITALSDFQCIATEMEMSPSNESILEMLKEKINQGFLKESEVVDVLIGNMREQTEKKIE